MNVAVETSLKCSGVSNEQEALGEASLITEYSKTYNTSFVPDEYWQSLEPAHKLVFGYGILSWEWNEGLRNYLYPLLFAFIYKMLDILRLDTRFLIVFLPRLFQSFLAAVADVYLYKFAKKLYGEKAAFWTIICYWLNWFVWFCSPRTLANAVEAQLTIIALYYYPWPASYQFLQARSSSTSPSIYMTLVALATIARPTSAIFWLPLCLWHFIRSQRPIWFLFKTVMPATLPILLLSIAVDRLCYGRSILSLWRFLEFNVLRGGCAHFGTHPWHWYLTNGLPTICFTHIILIAYGIHATKDRTMLTLCSFYALVHSLLTHKELRFMLPLLAPLFTYGGRYIDIVFRRHSLSVLRSEDNKKLLDERRQSVQDYIKWAPKRVNALVALLFVTNLPLIVYTGLFHQRGVLDIVRFLHDDSMSSRNNGRNVSVWFLTPCYTSPGYAHLHAHVQVRMLDCAPNLTHKPDYVDEADQFHANPGAWIEREFSSESSRPTHVVVYDWLWIKTLRRYLEGYGYRRCGQFYNTDFPQSERQSKYLIVACR